jgi:hypothetical protein
LRCKGTAFFLSRKLFLVFFRLLVQKTLILSKNSGQ